MTVRLFATAVLLIGLQGRVWAQTTAPPESARLPTVLKKVDSFTSQELLGFGFFGIPQCDGDGNIYFRPDESPRMEKNPVLKVSPKAKKLAEFRLPPEFKEFLAGPYAVDLDGNFHQVAYDGKQVLVLRFAGDGRFSGQSRLDVPSPQDLIPTNLGVFRAGEILLAGYFSMEAPNKLKNMAHSGIYHADGHLLAKISAKQDDGSNEPPRDWAVLPSDYIAMGIDGNAYFLRGKRILVLSPSGEIVRTLRVPNPYPDYSAHKIDISGGTISVEFNKTEKNRTVSFRVATLDLTTGELLAEYAADPELGKTPLCFNANEGYTFRGSDRQRLQINRGWVR